MSVGRLSCCFYTLMTLTTYGRADNWPGMVKTEILTVPLPSFFLPGRKNPTWCLYIRAVSNERARPSKTSLD